MNTIGKVAKVLAILSLSVLFAACSFSVTPGYIEDDKKNGEKEVQLFHDNYNQDKFEEIYNSTDDSFKKSQNKEDFYAAIKQVKSGFGKFVSVEDQFVNVIIGAPVQVRAVYVSKFENTEVTEMITYVKEGDKLKW